jgi:hypothetical protein
MCLGGGPFSKNLYSTQRFPAVPVPVMQAPLTPPLSGMFGRGSLLQIFVKPSHDLPAAVGRSRTRLYTLELACVILLNHVKAFVED